MPIRQTTPQSEIANYFEMQLQRLENAIVRTFCFVGEKCVNCARASHTYRDQTGNLTSSIGYAVAVDGQLVHSSSFNQVFDGGKGAKDGKTYVKQLIANYPSGITLIVVAGMEYAAYVSDKGYDVIDSAESYADYLVHKFLKQLGIKP